MPVLFWCPATQKCKLASSKIEEPPGGWFWKKSRGLRGPGVPGEDGRNRLL